MTDNCDIIKATISHVNDIGGSSKKSQREGTQRESQVGEQLRARTNQM